MVGAGGKTSWIAWLSERWKREGKRVAVCTSTHRMLPTSGGILLEEGRGEKIEALYGGKQGQQEARGEENRRVWKGETEEELLGRARSLFEGARKRGEGAVFEIGSVVRDKQGELRMGSLSPCVWEELAAFVDVLLVEADGSRRLPVKVPAAHEPVIFADADEIYVVEGLSALGRRGEEVCHRWEVALPLLKERKVFQEGVLSLEQLGVLLEEGYLKPLRRAFPMARVFPVLNQADTEEQRREAKQLLLSMGEVDAFVSSLREAVVQRVDERQRLELVYLASGFGRRYGSNKLLEVYEGKPLYAYGLGLLQSCKEELEKRGVSAQICVVSNQREILAGGAMYGRVFENPKAEEGIAASVRIGTAAAERFGADAAVFFVADQPQLRAKSVLALLESYRRKKRGIGRVRAEGEAGNPVVFGREYFGELHQLCGEDGGRKVIRRHPDEVWYFEVEARELRDIDYPSDWENL